MANSKGPRQHIDRTVGNGHVNESQAPQDTPSLSRLLTFLAYPTSRNKRTVKAGRLEGVEKTRITRCKKSSFEAVKNSLWRRSMTAEGFYPQRHDNFIMPKISQKFQRSENSVKFQFMTQAWERFLHQLYLHLLPQNTALGGDHRH